MSRYPVPIFQPTLPLGGSVSLDWLEKINQWMSLQYEKNEDVRRQLETQNHLLLQLNQRLDRVFLKLAMLESEKQTFHPAQTRVDASWGGATDFTNSPQTVAGNETRHEPEEAVEAFGGRQMQVPRTVVSSWQQQREAMLKGLVAQLEIEDSLYPRDASANNSSHESDSQLTGCTEVFPAETGLPASPLEQIETLKEQLHAAIREMEVECSVQRAKLSHERASLEAREADLERREKKLARESREQKVAQERAEPLVSRIKGMLRRGG